MADVILGLGGKAMERESAVNNITQKDKKKVFLITKNVSYNNKPFPSKTRL